ncbi:MAG: YihY/virulence factor BrkB family protein, partial [Nitrospira sp.]|nr:YihY/virulence factor BrkB family protein [Nitrospira sp.]
GFKAYVEHFGNYNAAYGSIAGVIVLMLWLYLTGMVMLLGGEINAQIEQAAAALRRGERPNQQVPPSPSRPVRMEERTPS